MAVTPGRRATRTHKSAEKPVSLYPLSFKQAVECLLKIKPRAIDARASKPTPSAARHS